MPTLDNTCDNTPVNPGDMAIVIYSPCGNMGKIGICGELLGNSPVQWQGTTYNSGIVGAEMIVFATIGSPLLAYEMDENGTLIEYKRIAAPYTRKWLRKITGLTQYEIDETILQANIDGVHPDVDVHLEAVRNATIKHAKSLKWML